MCSGLNKIIITIVAIRPDFMWQQALPAPVL
jgi:hypothetical protein